MNAILRLLAISTCAMGLAAAAPARAEGDAHGHAPHEGDTHAQGADAHGADAHGAHGDAHAPTFDDVNWFYGFLGEKEGVEPDLLWRPTGMPVPFGALALNAAILYWLLFKYGRKPIGAALRQRKLGIMKGIEDAAKMKAAAEARLAEYQKKLDEIDSEVARIRREMKESGEAESARILSEAKERRARMERDAHTLIDQELKAARESLLRDTVRAAVKSAETTLMARIGDADQQRLADEYLTSIKSSGSALRGRL
jgi:F-type H+-transporting ATPase subunit b